MGREERGVKRGFVGMEERGEEHIGGSGEERGGREGREESHGGREEERRELGGGRHVQTDWQGLRQDRFYWFLPFGGQRSPADLIWGVPILARLSLLLARGARLEMMSGRKMVQRRVLQFRLRL